MKKYIAIIIVLALFVPLAVQSNGRILELERAILKLKIRLIMLQIDTLLIQLNELKKNPIEYVEQNGRTDCLYPISCICGYPERRAEEKLRREVMISMGQNYCEYKVNCTCN